MGVGINKMVEKKIAFLFPGQGSQYVGMGKEFYDNFSIARGIYSKAEEILKKDMASLCFSGPEDELTLTANAQPAILINSIIVSRLLKKKGIVPFAAAGHSLGEYSAVLEAGALSLADGIQIVRKRGKFMQEAAPKGVGSMAAIIGLTKNEVEKLCAECSSHGEVVPANYNSPAQTVIAGKKEAVELVVHSAKKMGAKMAVELQVSVPSHCSMMASAEERLSKELDLLKFDNLSFPVITNVDAKEITSGGEARSSFKRQVSSPVLWQDSMRYLINKGINLFIELGPGRVLSGLIKRIDKTVEVTNVENMKSLEKTLKIIKESPCH